ncbi:hypothetical protein N7533_013349 [Penicillium manginii]|uniref:uncharacterized protein n=1 Tax=Penicillium manginii TaxID=203109 RepID=UPI002548DF9C|nr:uncharacterized protein N7533_013349 [Penicillium manginii]KAJ5732902.1 hypothetical protein N7533_013349 [Penicillium manginii]
MASDPKAEGFEITETIVVAAARGRLDLVAVLLERGEDPNTVNDIGTSALHSAAKRNYWDIARLLLEHHAIPGIQDGNNETPLQFAVRAGHKQIVTLLLECDPSIGDNKDAAKQRELHINLRIAALLGHTEIAKLLLDQKAPTLSEANYETALHLAAKKGHHDVCDLLLKHDLNMDRSLWSRMTGPSLAFDTKDSKGNTPFSYAVQNGFEKTVAVFLHIYPKLGQDCDREREPLFHKAITLGNIEVAQVFLKHGTDVEMKGRNGNRALHRAIQAMGFNGRSVEATKEMIRFLIESGASANSRNADGLTPDCMTNDPKIRTLLRNYMKTQSKSDSMKIASKALAPPPEYKS